MPPATTHRRVAGRVALAESKAFHRPSAGEALFRAEKGRKRLAPERTSVRLLPHRSAALLGNRRPAPNSHIHVFKRRRLFPAVACDARRALRRIDELGPHIHVLPACFSVSSLGDSTVPAPRFAIICR